MKINSYTKTAKTIVTLPKEFTQDVNMDLLSQAIHVYRNRLHPGTSKVQTRGEVSLRKGKAYRQKGTGNARHGARSAPIFVGGGKAHGPRGVKKVLELPKKMKLKALSSALAYKAKKNSVSIFSAAKVEKTKDAQKLIEKIREGEKAQDKKLTIVLSDKNFDMRKALSNLDKVRVARYQDLNAHTVFTSNKLVFDKAIFDRKDIFSKTKKK